LENSATSAFSPTINERLSQLIKKVSNNYAYFALKGCEIDEGTE
jgi:hypothetical protein